MSRSGALDCWDSPAAKWRVSVLTLFGWTRIAEFVHRSDAQRMYRELLRIGSGAKLEAL